MSWKNADVAKPHRHLIVLGSILEGDRRTVHPVTWDGLAWFYQPSDSVISGYDRRVTHWMPLPESPDAAEEERK